MLQKSILVIEKDRIIAKLHHTIFLVFLFHINTISLSAEIVDGLLVLFNSFALWLKHTLKSCTSSYRMYLSDKLNIVKFCAYFCSKTYLVWKQNLHNLYLNTYWWQSRWNLRRSLQSMKWREKVLKNSLASRSDLKAWPP